MIVVAIIGIVASIAIPAGMRYYRGEPLAKQEVYQSSPTQTSEQSQKALPRSINITVYKNGNIQNKISTTSLSDLTDNLKSIQEKYGDAEDLAGNIEITVKLK
jgi:biopolymer transport protein ExbD